MIRIIIVDDHKLFRLGLRRMLQDAHGLQIVGEAATGEQAVELARELRPSIVLMDIWMPGIGGLEAWIWERVECDQNSTHPEFVHG